ncbi:MAG: hypothetical protein JNL82_29760 [Myxococcales bacterium]|nr:hypothetical protein [Myxococcales bacterium]
MTHLPDLQLRLLPATELPALKREVRARGGWTLSGLAAEVCQSTLGRPQVLALSTEGPTATTEELDRIAAALGEVAAAPGDLGDARMAMWRDLIAASRTDLAPAPAVLTPEGLRPVRPPSGPTAMQRRARGLSWRDEPADHAEAVIPQDAEGRAIEDAAMTVLFGVHRVEEAADG